MYSNVSQFEPLFPADTSELEELAGELVAVSAKLEGRLSPVALDDLRKLLRVVNSYYSNLIEGNATHPIDIERAMKAVYSLDSDKRNRQIESRIHIEVQEKIIKKLKTEADLDVTSNDFLCWIHAEFYRQMPENLRWAKGENNESEFVEAGKLRQQFVKVGTHIAPLPDSIAKFLKRFNDAYKPNNLNGLRLFIALAAAHHRLMWIHPFLDGNGRVARLFTDAYFAKIGLDGYGIWNVSRGLARRRKEYRAKLEAADFPRENDLDGRGNLSDRTLTEFCRFFLEICIDQAEYMNSLLELPKFLKRLEKYVQLRNAGIIDGNILHPKTAEVFKTLATQGEISRGKVFEIIGMSERTGRNLLKNLFEEDLIRSDSPKGLVRLGFPAHAANYWFPELYQT